MTLSPAGALDARHVETETRALLHRVVQSLWFGSVLDYLATTGGTEVPGEIRGTNRTQRWNDEHR